MRGRVIVTPFELELGSFNGADARSPPPFRSRLQGKTLRDFMQAPPFGMLTFDEGFETTDPRA